MNERIKEFASKLGLIYCEGDRMYHDDGTPMKISELEKFAELVILEVLSDADEMMRLSNAYLDQGIDIELDLTKEIKNNFGIKDEQET